MMSNRLVQIGLLAATLSVPAVVLAQGGGMPAGSVSGTVTASGANGQIIKGANILVSLWRTDAATEASRDSACATWLADKSVWMQAKGEVESPSGINWTGTPVGKDLTVLQSLMAHRHDTTRTDANGAFTFASVPFGAYTIEAETFANDKFLQWSKDAAVIPRNTTQVALDPTTLAENQYCAVAAASSSSNASSGSAADRIYTSSELDKPLVVLSGGAEPGASADNGTVTIDFVVGTSGAAEPQTVKVKQSTGSPVSVNDARTIVSKLRYAPPTVKGVAVRAQAEYTAPIPSGGRRRR